MSELKNSWHTQLAIGILVNDEKSLDAKLGLLTEIGLATENEETFKICEEFRNRICAEEVEKSGSNELSVIYKRDTEGSSRDEVSDSDNGDE